MVQSRIKMLEKLPKLEPVVHESTVTLKERETNLFFIELNFYLRFMYA